MRWRIFVWIVRIAAIAALLYGVWCGVARVAGRHYFRRGMRHFAAAPAEAGRDFAVAVRLQPGNAQYRAALGRAYLRQGDYPSAARHLRAAAGMRPDEYGLWFDLGQACLKADSPAGAEEAFRKALAIRPEAQGPLIGLASGAELQGDWQSAAQALRTLRQQNPRDLDLCTRLAAALVKGKQYDEALKVCSEAGKLAPDVEPAALWSGQEPKGQWADWCGLLVAEGDAYRAKGCLADAILAYQRCLLIRHGHQPALDGLTQLPPEVVRRVAPDAEARSPRLSPDGTKVAFSADGVRIVRLDDGQVTPFARQQGVRPTERPAWSPDGRRLCYASDHRLHLVQADGTGEVLLVRKAPELPFLSRLPLAEGTREGEADEGFPTWSPDGRLVAFAYSRASDRLSLTVVADAASGVGRCVHHTDGTLPKLGAAGHAPAWSSDGRVLCGPLLYRAERQAPGLTLWSGDGVVKRQVGLPEGLGLAPADRALQRVTWSPDARYLAAEVRTQTSRTVLVIVPVTGRPGQIVAKDVVAHRWLDASHLWLLQRSGNSYVTADLRALVSDLKGNLKPAKPAFPVLLLGDWDLSKDAGRVVMCGPELGGKGLWVCDLKALGP